VAITIVLSHILFFLLIVPLPPTFTLFPYTTLFRSGRHSVDRSGPTRCGCVDRAHDGVRELARRWRHWYPSRDDGRRPRACRAARSEEHTSELQSRSDLVCRLLLEKKKTKYNRSARA